MTTFDRAVSAVKSGPAADVSAEIAPFNQQSWDRWQSRGRASDALFAHRVRMFALTTGAFVCLAGSFWMLF
jgi:hypothetical protein